jgi:hypothetical protein
MFKAIIDIFAEVILIVTFQYGRQAPRADRSGDLLQHPTRGDDEIGGAG